MFAQTWDMALDVYVPVQQPDLGSLVVSFFLLLDAQLRYLLWWVPAAVLRAVLGSAAGVALNGVTWFEFSPWAFYLLWLPYTVAQWVIFLWWAGRVLSGILWLLWIGLFRRLTLGWFLELAAAWVLRGSLAPPPVLAADDTSPLGTDRGERLAYVLGMEYAQEANVTHASVTAGGLTPSRLRGRSVWTNRLQAYLGGRPGIVGDLVRRRWVPDLPSSERPLSVNALLGLLDHDAKLLGGGVLPYSGEPDLDKNSPAEPFLVVETAKGRVVICPTLLAHLSLYACFRPRTQELLAGLRSRAREWLREKGIAELASAFVLPDTVAASFSETAPERLARERLDVPVEEPPSL